jgi:RsiW-degrading membrane proteinase PrsW (M82 family)
VRDFSYVRVWVPSQTHVVLLIAFALLVTGCRDHLAGTHDAALDYEIVNDDPSYAWTPQVAAAVVKQRLTAAQVTADVDPIANGVHVVVDKDLADFADDTIRWHGGLKVYLCDPAFPFAPNDATGLEQKAEGGERYFVGATADVARALSKTKLAKGHLVFGERVDESTSRTRVVLDPPILDLFGNQGITYVTNADGGKSLSFTISDAGNKALAAAAAEHANDKGARVAFVRSSSLIDTAKLEDLGKGPIVLSFGKDILAYTRAYANKRIIATLNLPTLHRTNAVVLNVSWGPAIACVVLPLAVSLAWLFFVRRFDRGRPEPWWLVLATFALGGLAVVPAGFVEYYAAQASPYLSPTVMTLGGQLMAAPVALIVFTVCVGLVEEATKWLGAWSLAGHRREFDEPVDGIVYGCAAALGFAAVENMKYFAGTRLSGTVVAVRAFLSVPAHMFFGAIWGYAMGRKLVTKKTSVFLWMLLASLAHGAFDTSLSIDGLGSLAIVLDIALALAFVFLLRRSLRYGTVAPETGDQPASSARAFFRMGSRGAFIAATILVLLLSAMLMGIGTAYEVLKHRIGVGFLAIATTLLAAFGLAAWYLTESIPLDAAIDERGITFAGVTSAWSEITGVERVSRSAKRAWLVLRTKSGDLRVGPGAAQTIDELQTIVRASVHRASSSS